MKVVGDLSQNAGPIDRIHSGEAKVRIDFRVGEERFDNVLQRSLLALSIRCNQVKAYLTVIESAFDPQVVHIRIQDCCHLRLLNWAHFAIRIHDENRNILFPTQTVNGRGACVSRCSANNSEMLARGFRLIGIAAYEEVFKEVAHELKGDVFEGEGRAVEELEEVEVFGGVEGDKRGDIGCTEGLIAASDDVFEV